MPDEQQIRYSALTGQSLYYLGRGDLKHKILAVAEEEGVAQASYALKLLQSDGRLQIAVAGKRSGSGRQETQRYEVEGPVMMFLTTTAAQPDEELANRCLLLQVNESRPQTAAILQQQRFAYTRQAYQRRQARQAILQRQQDAQRLLTSWPVVIPDVEQLRFRDDQTRWRREHAKYLTLIAGSSGLGGTSNSAVTCRGSSSCEVERILNATNVTGPVGLRDRALLETLYSTAIRAGELCNLQVYDLEPDRRIVTVRQGKGKKDRVVPIGQRALSWVQKYLADVRPALIAQTGAAVLFVTATGRPFHRTHLSALVRRYIKRAGIDKPGSCHLFRHSAATLMLTAGADLRALQLYLGHARLNTTQIYTHVSIQRLCEVHDRTHPAKPNAKPGDSSDHDTED